MNMNLNDKSIRDIYEAWNTGTDEYFSENPGSLKKLIDLEHLFHYDNVKKLDTLPTIDYVYNESSANLDLMDNIFVLYKPAKSKVVKVRFSKDKEVLGLVEIIKDQPNQDNFNRAKLITIEPNLITYYLVYASQDRDGNYKLAKKKVAEIKTDGEIPLISSSQSAEDNIKSFNLAFRGIKRVYFPTLEERDNYINNQEQESKAEFDMNPRIEYNDTLRSGKVRFINSNLPSSIGETLMIGTPITGDAILLSSPILNTQNKSMAINALARIENETNFVLEGPYTQENEIKFRYTTMPTAASNYLGSIVQYIGNTNETYIKGCFYTCASREIEEDNEGETVTVTEYYWKNISVQTGNIIELNTSASDAVDKYTEIVNSLNDGSIGTQGMVLIHVNDSTYGEFIAEAGLDIQNNSYKLSFAWYMFRGLAMATLAKETSEESGEEVLRWVGAPSITPIGFVPANVTGYDATKTQVLKNVNGTLTWVDEVSS